MDYYGIIGNPVQHSKSPLIHRLFAEQTKQDMTYSAILVDRDQLPQALKSFQNEGGKGLNITLPFKHKAYSLVDTLTPRAERAQAINTIKFNDDGTTLGDTTDGVGLIRDFTNHLKFSLKNKRILLLGAGGAVRGIIDPILNEKPAALIISNRTESKAEALAEDFASDGPVEACPLSLLENNSFDVVINGTSASLQEEMQDLPGSILREGALCYDMIYGQGFTPFLRWASEQGAATCVDGLGMLVEQAAESFYLWREVQPDIKTILAKLRVMLAPAELI